MVFIITSSKARGIGKYVCLLVTCYDGMAMCKILHLHIMFVDIFTLITFSGAGGAHWDNIIEAQWDIVPMSTPC